MKHFTEDEVDAINAPRVVTGFWDNFEEDYWPGDDDEPRLAVPEPLTATFSEMLKLTSRGAR